MLLAGRVTLICLIVQSSCYNIERYHQDEIEAKRSLDRCSSYDISLDEGSWGRTGKLVIHQSKMISQNAVMTITLSAPVQNWNHGSLKRLSKVDTTTYRFERKQWVMQINGYYEMPYTMYYKSKEAVIMSINIDGTYICNVIVTTTSPPITSTTSSSTSIVPSSTTTVVKGTGPGGCDDTTTRDWLSGRNGNIKFQSPQSANIELKMSTPPKSFNTWVGSNFQMIDSLTYTFSVTKWCCGRNNGVYTVGYTMHYLNNQAAKITSIKVDGIEKCAGGTSVATSTSTTALTTTSSPSISHTTTSSPSITTHQSTTIIEPETTTESTTTTGSATTTTWTTTNVASSCKYNYNDALHKSLLFYEAQRSGPLPAINRVSWRKSSTMNDGKECGKNLAGGYFDAGDFVKFNLPQASALTILAWGMIEFSDGYKYAGEYQNGLDAIRWGTDYLIKCHTAKNEFYAQVGNGGIDHAVWTRAFQLKTARPCYKVDVNKPGSDVAGEAAAALAASSIVFKTVNPAYSTTLLSHARELYDFARLYKGKYSDSIADAANFYNSWSGYEDELAWSSAWLYKATNEQKYLTDAKSISMDDTYEFSWDNKYAGAKILIAHLSGDSDRVKQAAGFCYKMKNQSPRTPKNMVFLHQWGSTRHAANVAFACMVFTRYFPTQPEYNTFGKQQIDYFLGDSGRSLVVGFGNNPPRFAHHSGSSCPVDPNTVCDWKSFGSSSPNPNVLYGALVGGPQSSAGISSYEDKRSNYVTNEVTIDYNAGFQSALAALLSNRGASC